MPFIFENKGKKFCDRESLIFALMGKFGATKQEAQQVVDFLIEELIRNLDQGKPVALRGLGVLRTRIRVSRKRNKTPEDPTHVQTVKFTAYKALKKYLWL